MCSPESMMSIAELSLCLRFSAQTNPESAGQACRPFRPFRADLFGDCNGAVDHVARRGQDRVADGLSLQSGLWIKFRIRIRGLPQELGILHQLVEGIPQGRDSLCGN